MTPLKEKEQLILDYIKKCFLETGYSPSVRDICDATGIKSTATVYSYIESLCEKGCLRKDAGKSRSLRPESVDVVRSVPVRGTVRAGQPIYADEENEEFVPFSVKGKSYPPDSLFALRIVGDSMKNAGILEGDTVIVEKTSVAHNGDIVVALIDDEATVKTFYKEHGYYRLQPENDEMRPIIVSEVEILGIVVANIRYY